MVFGMISEKINTPAVKAPENIHSVCSPNRLAYTAPLSDAPIVCATVLKATMATIGRRAAVVQLPGGKTLTGTTASLAWGAVHLALLSTGEDRGKAVVDWTWAGFTHDRAQRMTVRTDRD